MLTDRRYCYPLTISDFTTRYLFSFVSAPGATSRHSKA